MPDPTPMTTDHKYANKLLNEANKILATHLGNGTPIVQEITEYLNRIRTRHNQTNPTK